jgi:hypothetical protein
VRRGAASCRAVLAAVQWRRRSGRGAGAITAEPSWVERPGRRDRARSDCPGGWSPVARVSGRRPGRSLPCPPRPVHRGDVHPTDRADVRCPGVRCPGVRGIQVSGRTDLWCPQRCRRAIRAALDSGVARWGGPPQPGAASRRAPCPRAAWSPARIGPDGKGGGGVGRACLARRLTVARAAAWPASRLRRRLAAGPTAGVGPGPGCQPGGGGAWDRAGAPRPPQGVLGWSPV